MKLTVLTDNNTYIDRYYLGEPAFCCLIADGERLILFDTGYSDVFLQNARRMGIDLSRVTDVVLSHGHNDHTGGLTALFAHTTQPFRLFCDPLAFAERKNEGLSVGAPIRSSDLPARVEPHFSQSPVRIGEHTLFLGRIPRIFPFENGRSVGVISESGGAWRADDMADDTSLLLTGKRGGFVVTGCAHAGICNTVAYAKSLSESGQICGALGGFHLFDADERTNATAAALLQMIGGSIYPCHCTSLAVKAALMQTLDVCEVGVGLSLEI